MALNKYQEYVADQGVKKLKITKDVFWKLHSKNAIEIEHDKCFFLKAFSQYCVNNSFRVYNSFTDLSDREMSELDKEMTLAKEDIQNEEIRSPH